MARAGELMQLGAGGSTAGEPAAQAPKRAAGNALDRLIGWLNPTRGVQRLQARLMLRAYEAASLRDGWRPKRAGASADADHMADAATVRHKARALVQNVPYIAAGMEALVAQTVGTGIVPRATGRDADAINALHAKWVKECDADGRLDLYGIQAIAYRAMEQDGEVMIRLRWRRPTDGLTVPLQLQVLEIDWLDSTRSGRAPGGTSEIINGIEYDDETGAVVNYWLWPQHPGDLVRRLNARMQSVPVPASQIIHLYRKERPGQGRGISRLAPVITAVRDLSLYLDATLARKNLETRLGVMVSGAADQMANGTGLPGDPNKPATTGLLGELPSGGVFQLPPSMNMEFIEPTSSGGETAYISQQLHLIAAGWGVTYEMMTGDMSKVNYSSARVRLMDLRRQIEAEQWLHFIPTLCARIWVAFLDAAALAGKVRQPDYHAVDYSTPKWDYVNPEQDVRAEAEAIAAGLTSPSECIRRRGYNPKTVFEELRTDFDTLEKSGVLKILLLLQRGRVTEDLTPQPAEAAASGS